MNTFFAVFLSIIIEVLIFSFNPHAGYSFDNFHTNQNQPYVIAIDAGHSKKMGGATSARGIKEYWFNKTLSTLLQEKLNSTSMFKAILINETGQDLSLIQRVSEINKCHAKLLISIHHDSVQPIYLNKWVFKNKTLNYCDVFSGYSIFVSKKNTSFDKSYEIAHEIGKMFIEGKFKPTFHHAEMIKGESRELILEKLGVYSADFSVLSKSKIPAVLIECGIILNRKDEINLSNRKYQDAIVDAIYNALIHFYEKTNENQHKY